MSVRCRNTVALVVVAVMLMMVLPVWWYISELPRMPPMDEERRVGGTKRDGELEQFFSDAIAGLPALMRPDGARAIMLLAERCDVPKASSDAAKLLTTVFEERKHGERHAPSRVWMYDVKTRKSTPLPRVDHQNLFPTWGPNSQSVFYVAGHRSLGVVTSLLVEFDLSTMEQHILLKVSSRLLSKPRLASIEEPSVSPNGRFIVFAAITTWPNMRLGVKIWDDDLWCFDTNAGTLTKLCGTMNREGMAAISADSRRVAFVVADRTTDFRTTKIWVCDLPNGDNLGPVSGSGGAVNPAWSPDGSRLAFSRKTRTYTIPAEGGKAMRVTNGNAFRPQWSRDGRTIYFASWVRTRKNRRQWCLMRVDADNHLVQDIPKSKPHSK